MRLLELHLLGGLQFATEQREDRYHFLVFTDLFGNRTHGVVVQYDRSVQVKRRHSHALMAVVHILSLFIDDTYLLTLAFYWLSVTSGLSRRPEWPEMEFFKVPTLHTLCCLCHLQVSILQCLEGLPVMVIMSKYIQLIGYLAWQSLVY